MDGQNIVLLIEDTIWVKGKGNGHSQLSTQCHLHSVCLICLFNCTQRSNFRKPVTLWVCISAEAPQTLKRNPNSLSTLQLSVQFLSGRVIYIIIGILEAHHLCWRELSVVSTRSVHWTNTFDGLPQQKAVESVVIRMKETDPHKMPIIRNQTDAQPLPCRAYYLKKRTENAQ